MVFLASLFVVMRQPVRAWAMSLMRWAMVFLASLFVAAG